MSQLRTEGTPFDNTKEVIDYSVAVDAEKDLDNYQLQTY